MKKEKADLISCYELGRQTAWNNKGIDDRPNYRKQNKLASWLKGHTDGEREKQQFNLSNEVDREGLRKLKAIILKSLAEN